jgi:hypothetical protein
VKNFRFKVGVLVAASLALTACGTGTESRAPSGGAGRNVAVEGDDGLPFTGFTPNFATVAIDPETKAPWVGTGIFSQRDVKVGTITGGLVKVNRGDQLTVDTTFPRTPGITNAIAVNRTSGEIVVGGEFHGAGPDGATAGLIVMDSRGAARSVPSIRINALPSDIALIGDDAWVVGGFTFAIDASTELGNQVTGIVGFNLATGRMLRVARLQNFDPQTMSVRQIIPATDGSMRAALLIYNGSTGQAMIRVHHLLTGALVTTVSPSVSPSGIAKLDNGIVAYSPTDLSSVAFYDVTNGAALGQYTPEAGARLHTMVGAGRNARIVVIDTTGWRFRDINPATRTVVLLSGVMSGDVPRHLTWASPTETLTRRGVLHTMSAASGLVSVTSRQLINTRVGHDNVFAAAATADGFMVGGDFSAVADTGVKSTVLVPKDGDIPANPEGFPDDATLLASTPYGVVVRRANNLALHKGGPSSPAVPLAAIDSARNQEWFCDPYIGDIEWMVDRLWITGCWNRITVGGTTASALALEIDISGATPRIVSTYSAMPSRQIAATTNAVMIAESAGRLSLFTRGANRAANSMTTFTGTVNDIAAYVLPGSAVPEFVVGGWLIAPGLGREPGQLWRIRPTSNSITPVPWVSGQVRSLHWGPYGSSKHRLYIASNNMTVKQSRNTLVAVDENFEPLATSITTDAEVRDIISAGGENIWFVGLFTSVSVNGTAYRSSGIAGLSNFMNGSVIVRPTRPIVRPPLIAEVPVEVQPAVPAEPGVTESPAAEPATVLPELPTSGTPAEGVFTLTDFNGLTKTVTVQKDGTMIFDSPADTSKPSVVRLKPGSRTVRLWWTAVAGTDTYKVVAKSGRVSRSCRTTKLACTVKNVDPWRKWTFHVEAIDGRRKQVSDKTPVLKSFVSLKKGSSPRLTNIVKPGANGKASWKVNGTCKVSGAKLTTPKRAARCTLTVKAGKTTRAVSIRVS